MNVVIKRIAVMMLSIPHAPLPAMQVQTQDPEAAGREIVTQLAARHFHEVESRFDDRMKTGLPQEKLSAVWETLTGQVGAFQRVVRIEVAGQQSPRLVIVTCEFEHAALDAKIAVNAQGQVASLFFAPSASQPGQAVWSAPLYANQSAFHEREVTVGNGQWKLPGTLTLPNGKGPFAAIVLAVHDGNIRHPVSPAASERAQHAATIAGALTTLATHLTGHGWSCGVSAGELDGCGPGFRLMMQLVADQGLIPMVCRSGSPFSAPFHHRLRLCTCVEVVLLSVEEERCVQVSRFRLGRLPPCTTALPDAFYGELLSTSAAN